MILPPSNRGFLLQTLLFSCISALRMQEMVSMGIGSKPFMDIKPSDAAISDRAIDYIMKGTGELRFLVRCLSTLLRLTPKRALC